MAAPETTDAIRLTMRKTWSLGDYRKVAERQWPIATALCEWAGVSPGHSVLDVGTATGNVAFAAAERGAHATGLDLTPRMLEMATARRLEKGRQATFVLGDAEDLPFPDGSFDVVLSACGLWFAPRPERAVQEVLRVLRPGGRFGLANFTPIGYMGRLNELITDRLPLPVAVPEPNLWGREDITRTRLADFTDVAMTTRNVDYTFGSATEATEFFASYSPPHIAAAESLGPAAAQQLWSDVTAYTEREFRNGTGVTIPAEYLIVRGRAPGSQR